MNSVALPSSIPACAGRAPQVAARQQAAGSRPQAHATRLQATPRSSAATAAAAASAVSSPLVAAAGASVTVEKLGADVWNTTYYPKAVDHVPTEKTWYLVDAKGQRLGRMATLIATYLRGANAPTYTPSVDMGSYVVVVNVEQVQVTGRKRLQKQYVRHTTGRPGGMMVENFEQLQKRLPARIVEEAVWGMIPKERLGRHLFTHLKCYKGDKHPHSAQQPVDITHLIAERCMP